MNEEPTTTEAADAPESAPAVNSQATQPESTPPEPINSSGSAPDDTAPDDSAYREHRRRVEEYNRLKEDHLKKRVAAIDAWFAERKERTHASPADVALAESYRAEKAYREFMLANAPR